METVKKPISLSWLIANIYLIPESIPMKHFQLMNSGRISLQMQGVVTISVLESI